MPLFYRHDEGEPVRQGERSPFPGPSTPQELSLAILKMIFSSAFFR